MTTKTAAKERARAWHSVTALLLLTLVPGAASASIPKSISAATHSALPSELLPLEKRLERERQASLAQLLDTLDVTDLATWLATHSAATETESPTDDVGQDRFFTEHRFRLFPDGYLPSRDPRHRFRLFGGSRYDVPLPVTTTSSSARAISKLASGLRALPIHGSHWGQITYGGIASGVLENCLFHGLWTDPVTGISYARARWYDARNASFLSEDPLGDVDSPNLYQYALNSPFNYSDPLGEKCMGIFGGEETRCSDWLPRIGAGRYRQQRVELIRQIHDESLTREERNAAAWESNLQIPMWLLEETGTFLYNTLVYGWAAEWDEYEAVQARYAELLEETGGDHLAAAYILEEEGYDTSHLVKGGMPAGGPTRGLVRAARVGTGTTPGGLQRTTRRWRSQYGPAALRDHHLIPQALLKNEQFVTRMKALGVKDPKAYIDQRISRITQAHHGELHATGWNERWQRWVDENPQFDLKQLEQQVKTMMEAFNVPRASRNFVASFGRNAD